MNNKNDSFYINFYQINRSSKTLFSWVITLISICLILLIISKLILDYTTHKNIENWVTDSRERLDLASDAITKQFTELRLDTELIAEKFKNSKIMNNKDWDKLISNIESNLSEFIEANLYLDDGAAVFSNSNIKKLPTNFLDKTYVIDSNLDFGNGYKNKPYISQKVMISDNRNLVIFYSLDPKDIFSMHGSSKYSISLLSKDYKILVNLFIDEEHKLKDQQKEFKEYIKNNSFGSFTIDNVKYVYKRFLYKQNGELYPYYLISNLFLSKLNQINTMLYVFVSILSIGSIIIFIMFLDFHKNGSVIQNSNSVLVDDIFNLELSLGRLLIDEHGEILVANKKIAEWLNLSPSELKSKNIKDFLKFEERKLQVVVRKIEKYHKWDGKIFFKLSNRSYRCSIIMLDKNYIMTVQEYDLEVITKERDRLELLSRLSETATATVIVDKHSAIIESNSVFKEQFPSHISSSYLHSILETSLEVLWDEIVEKAISEGVWRLRRITLDNEDYKFTLRAFDDYLVCTIEKLHYLTFELNDVIYKENTKKISKFKEYYEANKSSKEATILLIYFQSSLNENAALDIFCAEKILKKMLDTDYKISPWQFKQLVIYVPKDINSTYDIASKIYENLQDYNLNSEIYIGLAAVQEDQVLDDTVKNATLAIKRMMLSGNHIYQGIYKG